MGSGDGRTHSAQSKTVPTKGAFARPEKFSVPQSSEELISILLEKAFTLAEAGVDRKQLLNFITQTLQAQPGDTVKVVSLVGGAASGKSTLARDLIQALSDVGVVADTISTDDYNLGDRAWRWERFEGDEARDPMGKWDFVFMNTKIEAIRNNGSECTVVKVPTYNQATGLAIDEGEENYAHEVGNVEVLIVEGDMARVNDPDLAVYLDVPDEQRLQSRVSRDLQHRSETDSEKVVANFHLRQHNQHIPYTLPAAESADYVVKVEPDGKEWQYDIYLKFISS
jgi:uridine kinase